MQRDSSRPSGPPGADADADAAHGDRGAEGDRGHAPPSSKPPPSLSAPAVPDPSFAAKLEKEEELVDALLAALARGRLEPETWRKLNAAAVRDERLSELAFAYESTAQGKRLKALPPAVVAEFLFQAAVFFGDVFGDDFGAQSYLERALATQPSHAAAFARLDALLSKADGDPKRHAEMCAQAALHRPRAEQAPLLRRAAELFDRVKGCEEQAIDLYQQIVRIDPSDETARSTLEARYLKANRHRDVARLLEQALAEPAAPTSSPGPASGAAHGPASVPPPPPRPTEAQALAIRARLIDVYASQLHELERTMPHVEALLAKQPAHDEARRVATKLLASKGLAARAAAALAKAHEVAGTPQEVARFLAIELEHTRGPKRREVLRRIGILRQDRLNDPAGAFEALENTLALDPADDEVRTRYVALGTKLGRVLDAAKALGRAATVAKDVALRTRINVEVGELLVRGGDPKRARTAFNGVLTTPGADPEAVVRAARALADVYRGEKDGRALAEVLERLSETDPDPERKRAATEQLAELAETTLGAPARAIAAWKKLVATPSRTRALAALERLYEAHAKTGELAEVLDERAREAATPAEARALAFRAADVLTKGGDTIVAAAAWKKFVETYGAAREAHARWIPLLETQRNWGDLAVALAAEAQLAPERERAPILARLGHVRLQRTSDAPGAIEAFRAALSLDPAEKTSRATLEKMLGGGDLRLEAAGVLEPLYRAELAAAAAGSGGSARAGLLRVLSLKAETGTTPAERARGFEEALEVAELDGGDEAKAIDFAAKGLAEAAHGGLPLTTWLVRVDRLCAGMEPKRRAAILGAALDASKGAEEAAAKSVQSARDARDGRARGAGRTSGVAEIGILARRAGEAYAAAGDVAAALVAYRRALAIEPSSSDLISRVDELLRDQGSPAERVALYRNALERGVEPARRRELLHRIGAIERHDLKDAPAAIAAYRAALADDADDRDARASLVDLYEQTANWSELCRVLEEWISRAADVEARRIRAQLAEVAAAHGEPDRAAAQCRALLAEKALTTGELDALERVTRALGNDELAHEVLERRAKAAETPRDEIAWLERLGALESERKKDEAAGATWKRAAQIAENIGDEDLARHLYARVRGIAPRDEEATLRLAGLLERAEQWGALPELLGVLLDRASAPDDQVPLLMRLARVYDEKLGSAAAATDAARRAFALAPRDPEVLATFERVAARGPDHGVRDVFARAIDEAVAAEDSENSAVERADLLLAKARVLGTPAAGDDARADDAVAVYKALLETPGLDEARLRTAASGLESILGGAGGGGDPRARLDDRRWLHAWRVEHAGSAGRTAALLAWALDEESVLGELGRALELHRRVLDLDPDSLDALAGVSRLALATGDVDRGIAALVARRERTEGDARNALDLEIATILIARTDRTSEALGCVASVLASTPNDAAALGLASRLLEADPMVRARAIDMLERAFEDAEDPAVKVDILRRLLACAGTSPDLREAWYERLLELLQAQGRGDEALATVVRAAEELPTVAALWDRAEALARERKAPDDVAQLYAKALDQPISRDEALELGQRAVAFHEEWFEDADRVVGILRRILEIDPTEGWAFDRLKLIFDAAERWDDLFTLYDRAIAAATTDKRRELLEDAAQIAKDFANHSGRAIGYLEQLLALRPGNARLTASLERLYERHGHHRELIGLLAAQLPQLGPREAQEVRARMTARWIDELRDASAALAVVEEMIAKEPEAAAATGARSAGGPATATTTAPDISALLERILQFAPPNAEVRDVPISVAPPSDTASSGSSPPAAAPEGRRRRDSFPSLPAPKRVLVRQRAAALLKERYAEAGRDADLVRVLEIELEAIKSVKERIRRHQQIAKLHLSLGNLAEAMDHDVALVVLEPDVAAHRDELCEIAAKIGRYDRLAEVLATAADDCTDDALRVDLWMQAAAVHADQLGDGGRAIELFFRVMTLPGIRDEAQLAAARRAEPLLEAAGRSGERLDVLERMATLEPTTETWRTAARLATELGDEERAIGAWERCLALAGDAPGATPDHEALDALVSLLGRGARSRELLGVLRRRAATAGAADPRADRVRAAALLGGELGDLAAAIDAWREVEAVHGASEEGTRALAGLFARTARWGELADLLSDAAAAAPVLDARAALYRELGDVRREHLGDPHGAVESYDRALTANPREPGARGGATALLGDASTRAAALAVLLKAYAATDEWELALGLTEHRVATAADDRAKIAALREASRVAEERAADLRSAFAYARRALAVDPADAALAGELARLAARTGDWRAFESALRDAIDAVEAAAASGAGERAADAARLRMRLGDVLESKLDDPRGALVAYQRTATDAPRDAEAGLATIRVAGRTMRWDAAARVVVDASREAGEVSEALATAIEEAATSPAAWDAATGAFAVAIAERGDLAPRVARDLEARLAAWHRDRRGDPDAAEAAFERALGHDGSDVAVLAALAQLQRRAGGRPLVESLVRLSTATGGDLDLLREAAEIATTAVADRALSKSLLERLMKLATERWLDESSPFLGSPTTPASYVEWSLGELVRLYNEEGDAERIVDLLVGAARLPFPREASRRMRKDAARMAMERLGDVGRAVDLYVELFDEEPEDAAVVAALVALYEAGGRRVDLLELGRKRVRATTDPARRLALRRDVARLEEGLGDVDAAIGTLRANLEDDAGDAATATELARVLEGARRFAELEALLAAQAALAEDGGDGRRAIDAWRGAARVAEEALGDVDRAIAHHRRVVAIAIAPAPGAKDAREDDGAHGDATPRDPRAESFDALARLTAGRGDHASAARYLEELRLVATPAQRAAVTLRLSEELIAAGDEALARQRLEEAAESDPDREEVRTRLADIYRLTGEWRPLAALLERGALHAPDKATRLSRLREGADLYLVRCADPEKAIPLLEQAADLDPADRAIRIALAGALGAASRFAEARTILRALIDGFGTRRPKERAPVHYHLARLELADGDRARALVELDAATRIDPANPEILRALAELARDDGQLERAERSYRALLAVLRRQDDADDGATVARSEVLLELSEIAARQGEKERAAELRESALETALSSDPESERFEQALRRRGDMATLVRALEARLSRAGETAAAATRWGELADVLDAHLGRAADALAARLRAIAIDPSVAAAHDDALGLARRTGAAAMTTYATRVTELANAAQNAGDRALACDLWLRVGAVLEGDLHDDAGAARVYERAHGLGVRAVDVLRALDRVYERIGDGEAQARVLAARIGAERTEAGGSGDAVYRLAALRLRAPETVDEGCDLLVSALDATPDLERAEAILRDAAAAHPKHARLLSIYERVGRHPGLERALVDALTRRWENAPTDTETLREAVDLAEGLGDLELTEALLRRFVAAYDPDATPDAVKTWALAGLGATRARAGDFEVAVALKRQAAAIAEPDLARQLNLEIAALAQTALHDPALAAATYELLHQNEPADRDVWEPLAAVYRQMGEWRRLAELLGRVADFVDDTAERSKLRLERARLMMHELGLGDEAAPLFREIVDDDPSETDAALVLAEILDRLGREDELAELLARQLDLAKDREDAGSIASLSLRLGALLEKRDRHAARDVYFNAVDWDPTHKEVLRALLRIEETDGDAANRADVMEKLLALEEGAAASKLAIDLAAVHAELGDPAAAERALEAGYKAHPASGAIRERLEAAYRARGAWAKLAQAYVLDASARTDPTERVVRLREAAAIYRGELADPAAAAAVLKNARAAASGDRALLADLVEMLAAAGDHAGAAAELTAALAPEAGISVAPGDRAALLAQRAQLRVTLGEDDDARRDLEEAYRLGGATYGGALAAQLERIGDRAARTGDAGKARTARLELAEVLTTTGGADAARALLGDLVKVDPRDRDALRALARLEEAGERWDAASAAYRRLVALEEGDAVVPTALRLADACERAGRLGDARGGLERARLAAPSDETLRRRLEVVYEQTGAFRELAELCLDDARSARDVAGRFAHLVRAGALLLQSGADAPDAIAPLEEAHALRPADVECVSRLADAYTAAARTGDATELLTAAIASHKGRRSRDLASLYYRLARVAQASGERTSEMAWLSSALDMDAQNGVIASELARIAMELGQLDVATRALRAVTMLKSPAGDPATTTAPAAAGTGAPMSKALAYQHLGEIARQQGDMRRAVMLLKRAIDDDPTLTSARALLAALQSE